MHLADQFLAVYQDGDPLALGRRRLGDVLEYLGLAAARGQLVQDAARAVPEGVADRLNAVELVGPQGEGVHGVTLASHAMAGPYR